MNVIFVNKEGKEQSVCFSRGQTILQVAEQFNIPIVGNCNGHCVCGSCHVIVENLQSELPQISDKENDALDNATGVTIKSRLACQIVLSEKLNGLRIRLV